MTIFFQFLEASDYASGVKSGISFVVDMIWLFSCCHYGFQVTERFENIRQTVYQLDWYIFPTNIQKDLQLMILSSQKSIYIEGFCNTRCTRDKFTKVRIFHGQNNEIINDWIFSYFQVINTTFSYFCVLRSFNWSNSDDTSIDDTLDVLFKNENSMYVWV